MFSHPSIIDCRDCDSYWVNEKDMINWIINWCVCVCVYQDEDEVIIINMEKLVKRPRQLGTHSSLTQSINTLPD